MVFFDIFLVLIILYFLFCFLLLQRNRVIKILFFFSFYLSLLLTEYINILLFVFNSKSLHLIVPVKMKNYLVSKLFYFLKQNNMYIYSGVFQINIIIILLKSFFPPCRRVCSSKWFHAREVRDNICYYITTIEKNFETSRKVRMRILYTLGVGVC